MSQVEWAALESKGVVFLPAAGDRVADPDIALKPESVSGFNGLGYYLTSECMGVLWFTTSNIKPNGGTTPERACAIRVVKQIEDI